MVLKFVLQKVLQKFQKFEDLVHVLIHDSRILLSKHSPCLPRGGTLILVRVVGHLFLLNVSAILRCLQFVPILPAQHSLIRIRLSLNEYHVQQNLSTVDLRAIYWYD